MASFNLTASDRFPVGTSVGAYPESNWQAFALPPSGPPPGAATETQVVGSSGAASFVALADGVRYQAYASVSGQDRYVAFRTPAAASGETIAVSAAALPLPTGAAKDSTLTDGSQRVGGVVATSGPADSVTTGTITATGQAVTAPVVSGMGSWFMSYYGTYATGPSLTMEVSFDGGTTFASIRMVSEMSATLGLVLTIATGANATNCFVADIPTGATHLRVRASAFGASGTINVVLGQSSSRSALTNGIINAVTAVTTVSTVSAVSAVTAGVAATSLGKAEDAAAASGDTGVFGLGVRNDALGVLTSTDGDYSGHAVDARGATFVNPAVFAYAHISTAATTTVKSGAGTLHSISVNTKGTVASTITVYDNTVGSGTVIAVIDSLNLSGPFVLDVAFATGLTLVTTGTVAPDVTVSYR